MQVGRDVITVSRCQIRKVNYHSENLGRFRGKLAATVHLTVGSNKIRFSDTAACLYRLGIDLSQTYFDRFK